VGSSFTADLVASHFLQPLRAVVDPRRLRQADLAHGYTLRSQLLRRCIVSNSNTEDLGHATPLTIAAIVERCQPMGDLGRFAIDDLTAAEEDEFFAILENV
jgi:hypothetical protein